MEHLLEYQDYILAYRLKILVGGKNKPRASCLSLGNYAAKRLERQKLAENLLSKANYHPDMRRVDELTAEINFGFWHNAGETTDFLRYVIHQGGCVALETEENFITYLLTPLERSKLDFSQETIIARYYLGLLRASSAYLDAEIFTRLRNEIEPLRNDIPVFVIHSPDNQADISHSAKNKTENREDNN